MVTKSTEGPFRPYAPPANLVAVFQRLRRMNMPPKISREFLSGAGITDAIAPRVVSTLKFLNLINESDEPSDTLRALATSTEEEYKQILQNTIRTAYAEDFTSINIEEDTQDRIMNVFQRYTPKSQHLRQVILLLGLCKEAGMRTKDTPRGRGMQTSTSRPKKGRPTISQQRDTVDTSAQLQVSRKPTGQVRANIIEEYLGITLEDAAYMPEKVFREIWNALGTAFRLRAQRLYLQPEASDKKEDIGNKESAED